MKSPLLKSNIVLNYFANFLKRDSGSCLFFFLVGLALRGIPELLITPYPVGYETITYYAPVMMSFHGKGLVDVFVETFWMGPLFYVLMWLATAASGAHAFLLLKATGPVLYGFLAVVFFVFLRRGLKLEWKIAFLATLILVFQPLALRESWDRFKAVLGLIFFFATLTVLKGNYKSRWLLVALFGVLTALSREYVALVLFVAVLGFAILERKNIVMSVVVLVPAYIVFLFMIYLSSLLSFYPLGIQLTWAVYLGLVTDILLIFAFGYVPLLPLVVKGFTRNTLLDPMVACLLLGSFSTIVIPWMAVPGYQRWLMLLVFPFSVYAVIGLERFHLFDKGRRKVLWTVLLIFILIGVGYSTGTFSYIGTNSYIAVNLVQSSISWNQINDVKGVLSWLDENAVFNSSVLAEERFYGWTLIYFRRAKDDVKVIEYGPNSSPVPALEAALRDGFSQIYLIWYTEQSLNDFQIIHSQNSVSIFQYVLKVA